jgi:hypothetical protein
VPPIFIYLSSGSPSLGPQLHVDKRQPFIHQTIKLPSPVYDTERKGITFDLTVSISDRVLCGESADGALSLVCCPETSPEPSRRPEAFSNQTWWIAEV